MAKYILCLVFVVMACFKAEGQIPTYVPLTGLLGYYPFNNNTNDATAYANHGIASGGVSYGTDRFGSPLSCYVGNVSSGVDVPVNNFPVGNAARSVSVFFKSVMPYQGGYGQCFSVGDNAALGRRFGLFVYDTSVGLEYINGIVGTHFIPDASWHHLVVTYTGVGGSAGVKVYLDGALAPMFVSVPIAAFNTATSFIHCFATLFMSPSYLYSFKGSIDDIAIWDRAITPCEVYQIWKATTSFSAGTITGSSVICVGTTTTCSTTGTGGIWSSTNTAVATVGTTGVVSGLTPGTSAISYTVTNVCGTWVATQVVTVVPVPSVTGITTLVVGATTTLSGAPAGGTWSSGNTAVATVGSSSGFVTAIAAGTSSISYTSGSGCIKVVTVTVTSPLPSCAQLISTIAGNGSPGSGGDGTPATAAQLSMPWGVAADAAGNVYIADEANHRIRKVSPSGIISTFAGNGTPAYTGDGGPATAASLNKPFDVKVDAAGNVYIADNTNHVVRKVNTAGVITTYAGNGSAIFSGDGGSATAAGLGSPSGICADASGNVYIAADGLRIRKVSSAGVITTFAGTGTIGYLGDGGPASSARLRNPVAMTADASGNVFIADQLNNVIRKVNLAGVISTVAGTGTAGFFGDGGQATAARFNNPWGIAVDAAGNIFIGDHNSNRIRRVTPSGIVSTVAGDGVAGFLGDGGLATAARINNHWGIAADASGNIYIADGGNNRVRKVSGINTSPWFVAGHTQSLTVCGSSGANSINALLAANDPNAGQAEVWSVVTAPLHGTLVAAYTTTSTGAVLTPSGLSYTPSTGYVGTDMFKVRILDCGGAADTTTVFITVSPPLSAGTITGPSAVCVGSVIALTDAATGGMWTSSNTTIATVSSAGFVTGVSQGTATISYLVSGACGSSYATAGVTVYTVPGPISGPSSVCVDATINLTDAVSGGTWKSGNTLTATISGSGLVTGITPGTALITYTNGICTATTTVTVNPSLPVIAGVFLLCVGQTTALSNSLMGGAWSSGNVGVATVGSSSGIVMGIAPGTATITYSLSGLCDAATIVDVSPMSNAGSISGSTLVCFGRQLRLSDTVAGGVWSSGNTAIATVSGSGLVSGIMPGTVTISYTVTNACGPAFAVKVVTVAPVPDAGIISGPVSVCIGAVFTLSETVAGGTWISGSPAIATIGSVSGSGTTVASGITVITYTSTNAAGCSGTKTFTLTILAATPYTVAGTVVNVHCFGGDDGGITTSVTGGSGPYMYVWSNAATSPFLNDLLAGGYTLQVEDVTTKCVASKTFVVKQPDSLLAIATVKSDFCKAGDGTISVDVVGGVAPYGYLWSNSATVSALTGLPASVYTLTVTDASSCSVKFPIVVADTCDNIVVHDVITPNGDGINDLWVIPGILSYPANTVQVFDKWGDIIYEKQGYNNDWAGKGKNGDLPDGTYFYLVKLNATVSGNRKTEFTGAITIKR